MYFRSAQKFTTCSWVRATSNDWTGRNKLNKYAEWSVLLRRGFISWMNGEPLENTPIRPRRKDASAIIFFSIAKRELECNSVERWDEHRQWRGHSQSRIIRTGQNNHKKKTWSTAPHSPGDTFSVNSCNQICPLLNKFFIYHTHTHKSFLVQSINLSINKSKSIKKIAEN